MLKQATKWVKDSFKPYKHENQKLRDKRQLIDGIVNLVVGTVQLLFKLINLIFIVPIKALITDPKNFTKKYNEIGKDDIETIVPTFRKAISGLVMTLTSPLLPIRILLRLFLTPKEGISIFANAGLKKLVDNYFRENEPPKSDGFSTFAAKTDKQLPIEIDQKSKRYEENKQKDSSELRKILSKPTLTYYKMLEIKSKIEEQSEAVKEPKAALPSI